MLCSSRRREADPEPEMRFRASTGRPVFHAPRCEATLDETRALGARLVAATNPVDRIAYTEVDLTARTTLVDRLPKDTGCRTPGSSAAEFSLSIPLAPRAPDRLNASTAAAIPPLRRRGCNVVTRELSPFVRARRSAIV